MRGRNEHTTRRKFLRAVGGLGAGAGTAGCQGLLNSSESDSPTPGKQTQESEVSESPNPQSLSIADQVSQRQYNAARTGVSETTPLEEPLEVVWEVEYEGTDEGRVYHQPIVADGTVFFAVQLGGSRYGYAVDATTGEVEWIREGFFPIAVDQRRLYALGIGETGSGVEIITETLDRQPLWTFTIEPLELEDRLSYLTLDANTVYILGSNLYAVDRSTGALKWVATAPGTVDGTSTYGYGMAASDDHVFLPRFSGYLYAVDSKTGDLQWWYRPPVLTEDRQPAVPAQVTPAVADAVVYGGSSDGRVYALDEKTGDQQWLTSLEHPLRSHTSLVVLNDLVIVSDKSGVVYGLDAGDGTILWRNKTDTSVHQSPLAISDTVYTFGRDQIWAIASDGTVSWDATLEPKRYLQGPPVIVDGFLFMPLRSRFICLR